MWDCIYGVGYMSVVKHILYDTITTSELLRSAVCGTFCYWASSIHCVFNICISYVSQNTADQGTHTPGQHRT